MENQGLIRATLASGETAKLLGISEKGFNRPAATLAKHNRRQTVTTSTIISQINWLFCGSFLADTWLWGAKVDRQQEYANNHNKT